MKWPASALIAATLSTPAVAGDTIYFGSWDGQLYSIG